MILFGILEEIVGIVWCGGGGHDVVENEVDHEEHASSVQLCGERLEVVGGAKVGVELRDVCDPVARVRVAVLCTGAVVVFVHGGYPDSKDVRKRRRSRTGTGHLR